MTTATTKATAYVEVRSQHSRGSSSGGFGGPDAYVAVQVVPDGVERLKVLNSTFAAQRGIEIIYCGEGYSQHSKTARSALGAALSKANRIAAEINNAAMTATEVCCPNCKVRVEPAEDRRGCGCHCPACEMTL